uniref:Uncharacterized protein n=1 Tax=Plectus sambesii TaxID=2011161 RepID=A0A914X280_9BILA
MVSTVAQMIILIMIVYDVWAQPRPNIGGQEFNRDKNNGYAFDKVVHPSAPYQLPTLRKDPPVTRSCSTRGAKGSTNEELCNIAQEQRCNEEDKEIAGGQVATDTKTKTRDDANECYFKHERLNPDGLEKNKRPDHSKVSTECDDELRSFEELADSQPLLDLHGAENNADLALIRGAAEFGNDFDDEADADTVVAILRNVLEDLKELKVEKIVFRSDNADCYKSSLLLGTINQMSQESGIFISRYAFSEAQAGKSSCDRMAAVVKRKLRDHIDQGNDVINGADFIKAMNSAAQINGMKFFGPS